MMETEEQGQKSQRNSSFVFCFYRRNLTGYVCLALQEVFSALYQEMSVLVVIQTEAKFLISIIPP